MKRGREEEDDDVAEARGDGSNRLISICIAFPAVNVVVLSITELQHPLYEDIIQSNKFYNFLYFF